MMKDFPEALARVHSSAYHISHRHSPCQITCTHTPGTPVRQALFAAYHDILQLAASGVSGGSTRAPFHESILPKLQHGIRISNRRHAQTLENPIITAGRICSLPGTNYLFGNQGWTPMAPNAPLECVAVRGASNHTPIRPSQCPFLLIC